MPELPSNASEMPFTLRFRVGPFPVAVEPMFWIIPLAGFRSFGWASLGWLAVVFVSVMVHELGHAFAARRYGSSASIRLTTFGGLTYHDALPASRQRLLVAIAGPLAGFAFGLVALAASFALPAAWGPLPWFVPMTLSMLMSVNFGWGVINLLPIPPLDGGHVFEEAVGRKRRLLVAQVGTLVGVAATLEGLRRWGVFAAVMFGFLAARSGATWLRLAAERRFQRQLAKARAAMWEEALEKDQVGEAHRAAFRDTMRLLKEPLPAPPAPPTSTRAEPDGERDPALLSRLFEELGMPARAAEHALEAHRAAPTDATALRAVRLLVAAGRKDEARALVARTAWSGEAARAEASALL